MYDLGCCKYLSRPVVVLDGVPGLYGFKYDSATACGTPLYLYSFKLVGSATVVRNKAKLVAQGYTQVEGLDFGERYTPVARLEAIRILLAYSYAHNIKLYQMDIKSAFLNGYINEEVYVEQPPGFEDDHIKAGCHV